MNAKRMFRYGFVLFISLAFAEAWDGHYCSKMVAKYYPQYYCSCTALWWCCGDSLRYVLYYTTEQECCPGWTHSGDQNCTIPICVPACLNGGKCASPNTCVCAAGYDGDICDGTASCSHLDPCYPGRCIRNDSVNRTNTNTNFTSTTRSVTTTVATTTKSVTTTVASIANKTGNSTNSVKCECSNGFYGPSCLLFSSNYTVVIEQSNATFSRKNFIKNELITEHKFDTTNKAKIETTWTNDAEFNIIETYLHASFDPNTAFGFMPELPNYVRNTSFGIVDGHFEIIHMKVNAKGIQYVANAQNLTCSAASKDNPVQVLKCYQSQNNDISLASGDVYTLRFRATSGGYRVLINTDTNNVTGTDYYLGPTTQNGVEFRFDYDVPVHCQKLITAINLTDCSKTPPMTLKDDITMNIITPRWGGWTDDLSGVARYVFEVWKMEFSVDENGLKEPSIKPEINPNPSYITEIFANNVTFPSFECSEPGVYSCILEINDKANNSEYVRRVAICDKWSNVSLSMTKHLYVSTASSSSDYMWQTTYSENDITIVNITWTDHFVNTIHENGHFLAKILKYEARLSDPNNPNRHNYKRIVDDFDDNEGARTKAAIENINSIVKFEIIHEYIKSQKAEPSESNWRAITPIREHDTIELGSKTIADGYAVQVWVKAYDILNNAKVDTTVVRFDKTPPVVHKPEIAFNIKNGKYKLTSRITLISNDDHSGLKRLSLVFVLNSTGEIRRPIGDIIVKNQTYAECPYDTNPDCYCIYDDCFTQKFIIDIENCQLTVPVDSINYESYTLQITAYNNAMLTQTRVFEIGNVLQFSGIQQYSSPTDITVISQTDTTITIRWRLIPTCFERIRNVVVVTTGNITKEYMVDKDSTEYTIPNLNPSAPYVIQMYSDYGNETHFVKSVVQSRVYASTQEAAKVFPQYGFYAIGGGFFVILMTTVIIFVVLGRMGKLQKVKKRVTKRISYMRNTWYNYKQVDRAPRKSRNNRAISKYYDNDVHFYGDMEFEGEQHWHIKRRNVSLEEEIARGKFAIIFKAKLYSSKNVEEIVVAKTLHEDCTELQKTEMKAKIHFFATKVGHHVNILEFKGSVEDDSRGSMMILEYCKNGTLKQYLDTIRECFNTEISDKLARISYQICLGMDYLSSREIVHRRLAARNILLNHLYEAKIAGFGPDPEEDRTNVNEIHQENVPVKWVAPECITSSSNATELSDAWSYGVVLWEIYSLGEKPYPGINSSEISDYLKEGERMDKPEYCDATFYKIMKRCWQYDHRKRLGFAALKEQMRPLFHQGEGDDIYLQVLN